MIRGIPWARFLPLLFLWAFFSPGLKSQTVLTSLPSHILCPNDSVILPVQVSNFNNVSSISLSLLYDPLYVDFLGYQDVNAALQNGLFLVNDVGTQIKIAWFSINPIFIDTGVMLKLRFRYLTGYGTLIWDTVSPGGCQYGNATGATMPALFTGAYLSANGAVMQQPQADTIMAGDTASFGIQALEVHWRINGRRIQDRDGLMSSTAFSIQGPTVPSSKYRDHLLASMPINTDAALRVPVRCHTISFTLAALCYRCCHPAQQRQSSLVQAIPFVRVI
ncbi:MAG: hypothetical protein IH599_09310 [Bacteroidales bacterium]|nr:hypothetical protein [Bacteroidales bacterium]